jgi:hypothetical protein
LLKNLFGETLLCSANRFVRQQQRKKSMKHFVLLVNPLFSSAQAALSKHLAQLLDFVQLYRTAEAGGEL